MTSLTLDSMCDESMIFCYYLLRNSCLNGKCYSIDRFLVIGSACAFNVCVAHLKEYC